MASHSWGDNVFRNFLMWATEEPGADPNWAEEHIHAYINIAGPVLGVAKSITSLLSGMVWPASAWHLRHNVQASCQGACA